VAFCSPSLPSFYYPQRHTARQIPKTRLDFLREQKDVLYENLRDLNFEYSAGNTRRKTTRPSALLCENETAAVLAEIDQAGAACHAVLKHFPNTTVPGEIGYVLAIL